MGHVLMENRNGLAVNAALTHATGTAEREATLAMLDRRRSRHRITLGADKAAACPWAGQRPDPRDVEAVVGDLRARRVTPPYRRQRRAPPEFGQPERVRILPSGLALPRLTAIAVPTGNRPRGVSDPAGAARAELNCDRAQAAHRGPGAKSRAMSVLRDPDPQTSSAPPFMAQ